jgi:uncharacterized protein (TIGR02646 family)
MHFIEKRQSPDFFEEEKGSCPLTENIPWKKFRNPCKRELKKFIIEEQKGLCIYCECYLSQEKSHIEHLRPQSKYKQFKFEYNNLSVSCNGEILCTNKKSKHGKFCGHKKNNIYDEQLFLNPLEQVDIEKYFDYDSETGAIIAKKGDKNQESNYMINLLNLNTPYLKDSRKYAKELLLEKLSDDIDRLQNELMEDREFISFLKSCFIF